MILPLFKSIHKTNTNQQNVILIFKQLAVSNFRQFSFEPYKRQPHKMDTVKLFVGNLSTNCSSVFDHFVGLALEGLRN